MQKTLGVALAAALFGAGAVLVSQRLFLQTVRPASDKTIDVCYMKATPNSPCKAIAPDTVVYKNKHVTWVLRESPDCGDNALTIVPNDLSSWNNDLEEKEHDNKMHKFLVKGDNQKSHKYKVMINGKIVLDPWIQIS